jgi:F5/8 type C domain
VAAVAWSFSHAKSQKGNAKAGGGGNGHGKSASPSTASSVVLKPVSATAADNSGEAAAAIDGSATTDWHSQFYIGNPVFGGLGKKGSGLVIDMGTQVKLSQVQVQFGTTCCASVQIGIGNSDDPTTDSGFTTVARSSQATATMKFNVSSSDKGRYVTIWFTKLPPEPGNAGNYEAQVYNVVVRGSS